MHSEIDELAKIIQEAADLLASVGEKHWGQWLKKDAELIRNSDFRGVEHFLSAFGGMGSINDLVIHNINGHSVTDSQIPETNSRFESLLNLAAKKAKKYMQTKSMLCAAPNNRFKPFASLTGTG